MIEKEFFYSAEYANEVMKTIPPGYINKTICGCGLTTVAIENNENVVITMPSIGLVTNKEEQYPNIRFNNNILGIWGETTDEEIDNYVKSHKILKILVTYNSLYRVKHLLNKCRLIIDESNEILKSSIKFPNEIDTLFELAKRYKDSVSFISATPIPLIYLPKWISTLDQIKINWKGTKKVKPILLQRTYPYKALKEEILKPLLSGPITIGSKTFSSVTVFINSVEKIVSLIKECGINKSECSIICGDNLKNDLKISGIKRYSSKDAESKFLFITRSGFSGIDLYSKNSMTVVVSNTAKKWQMLDMLTDLKQAVSRQRNKYNPNYGSYIYIYNQSIFTESEEALLDKLEATRSKIKTNIEVYDYLKEQGKEKDFNMFAEFETYTIFKNGKYYLNEIGFNADAYHILEIRRQYTKGFDIKTQGSFKEDVELEIEEVNPINVEKEKTNTYEDLVNYFNINKEKTDWNKVSGKDEYKEIISKCYSLYGRTYKNQTVAKNLIANYGNEFEQIKVIIKSNFIKGKLYTTEEIKTILGKIYKDNNITRTPKLSDLNEVIKTKQMMDGGKRKTLIIN